MKVLILNGSYRKNGNTETLLIPFVEELERRGASVRTIALREKEISHCNACWVCQNAHDGYGCSKRDDMHEIADAILAADCFILATPIYSWYCTPVMKAMLDRHYGMNKYYGDEPGPCLWKGKRCGIIATCGYPVEYGAGPFRDGMERLCKHSNLVFEGMLAIRDTDDRASFQTEEAVQAAIEFAGKIAEGSAAGNP